MSFSIRLTDTEKALAESYAKLHAISLGEAFKRALFEKIEDEYDIALAEEAYAEYLKDGKQAKPIEELWKELDFEDVRSTDNCRI
ncbi:MAG: type II toxin-antitoxin system RelB family antitoxin [Centipeda sp. (in: firmicutes)]